MQKGKMLRQQHDWIKMREKMLQPQKPIFEKKGPKVKETSSTLLLLKRHNLSYRSVQTHFKTISVMRVCIYVCYMYM